MFELPTFNLYEPFNATTDTSLDACIYILLEAVTLTLLDATTMNSFDEYIFVDPPLSATRVMSFVVASKLKYI
jgi:hypothetical protein